MESSKRCVKLVSLIFSIRDILCTITTSVGDDNYHVRVCAAVVVVVRVCLYIHTLILHVGTFFRCYIHLFLQSDQNVDALIDLLLCHDLKKKE